VLCIDAETSRVICTVTMNERVPFGALGEEQMREGQKKQRHIQKIDKQYQETRRAANMSLTDLAIETKMEQTNKTKLDKTGPTPKPVKTFVDGQLKAIKNSEKAISAEKIKKATGTDGAGLEIDLEQVRKSRNERKNYDLEFGW
jgi:hypothetical protein